MNQSTAFLVVILSVASSACEPQRNNVSEPTDQKPVVADSNGPAFKRELIKRIGEAEYITITEQSYWTDFIPRDSLDLDGAPRSERDAPKYDYRSVRLTDAQKRTFLQAAEGMNGTTEMVPSFCGFEPHHRIDFQSDEGLSSMIVCFQCEYLQWKDVDVIMLESLFPILNVIKKNGFITRNDLRSFFVSLELSHHEQP